jgi:hypothetical protein
MDKFFDVLWWTGPKDETVSRIHISRLYTRVLESLQNWVDNHTCEGRIEEFGLLLDISGRSMRFVALL